MNRTQMLRNAYNKHWGSLFPPTIYIDGPRGMGKNKKNLVRYKIVFSNDHSIGDFDPLVAELTTLPHVEEVYAHHSLASDGRNHYWSVMVWFRGRASEVKKVATVRPPAAWEGVEPIVNKPTTNLGALLRDKFERDEMAKAEAVKVCEKFDRLVGMVDELSLNYDDLNMLVLLIGMQGDADFIADTLDPVNEMDWQLDKDGCTYADPIRAAAMMDDIVNETEMNRMAKKLRDAGVDLNKLFRVRVEQKVTVERVKG